MPGAAARPTPRLLALDLDGTTFGDDMLISPRVAAAVARTVALGVTVSLMTGRMYVASARFAEQLHAAGPLVCYQGAAIYDVASGRKLQETPLAHDLALRVVRRAQADGFHVQLYHDDRFYVEEYNRYAALYARLAGVEPVVVASLTQEFAGRDTTKLNIVTDPQRAARYVETVRAECGDAAYVTRSNPEFIEVLNPTVDKGTALRFVAARLGVPLAQVLAIGDSYNDVPLLETAGFGIAMGSAPAELKAVAGAVVADVAHDGVAEALERFVFAAATA
jgi:Cof subfamily protein (haloacid dehalogenase superfamily)